MTDARPVALALTPMGAREKAVLAAEVALAHPRARLAVRRADIRTVIDGLRGDARPQPEPPDPERLAIGLRLGRAVTKTLRWLPGDSRCLTQALVLTKLLARRGMAGAVVIGVRPGEDFGAHAWVELGGVALLPAGEGEYERLTEL